MKDDDRKKDDDKKKDSLCKPGSLYEGPCHLVCPVSLIVTPA